MPSTFYVTSRTDTKVFQRATPSICHMHVKLARGFSQLQLPLKTFWKRAHAQIKICSWGHICGKLIFRQLRITAVASRFGKMFPCIWTNEKLLTWSGPQQCEAWFSGGNSRDTFPVCLAFFLEHHQIPRTTRTMKAKPPRTPPTMAPVWFFSAFVSDAVTKKKNRQTNNKVNYNNNNSQRYPNLDDMGNRSSIGCIFLNNHSTRLSMMWRIMQIQENIIPKGQRPKGITSSQISIIHSKYFNVLKKLPPRRL